MGEETTGNATATATQATEPDKENGDDAKSNSLFRRMGVNPNLVMLKITLFMFYGGKFECSFVSRSAISHIYKSFYAGENLWIECNLNITLKRFNSKKKGIKKHFLWFEKKKNKIINQYKGDIKIWIQRIWAGSFNWNNKWWKSPLKQWKKRLKNRFEMVLLLIEKLP